MLNGDLHDAVQAIKENPTTAKEVAAAYAEKYPTQVGSRVALGPGLSMPVSRVSPVAGATLGAVRSLAIYGNAIEAVETVGYPTNVRAMVAEIMMGGTE